MCVRLAVTTSLATILLLSLIGCRLSSEPPAGPSQVSGQQEQQMAEIMAYLKEKDASLDELRNEIRELRATEDDPGGIKALKEDVRVCKALVGAARKAASEKTLPPVGNALRRLIPALTSLRAMLPAARMAEHIERALQAMESYQPQDAQSVASRSLLQTTDIAMKAPPTLAPTVIRDIESAKAQVDRSEFGAARDSLLSILERLTNEESVHSADRALAAARMAQSALDLSALGILQAQLDYMDQVLSELQQKIEGAITPLAPAQPEQGATAPAAAQPATPEAAAAPAIAAPPTPPTN